jgi:hypothetical protein
MKHPNAIADYREYSVKDHIEMKSFMSWASAYGVSAVIVDGSDSSTKFSHIISFNGEQSESESFDYWPDAIDDMVERILEFIDPIAEIRQQKDNPKFMYEANLLKASNLCAEIIDQISAKEYDKEETDKIIRETISILNKALL